MLKLIFKNHRNELIDLISNSDVRLTTLLGVGAVANISRQSLAGRDGSTPGKVTRPERMITVNFRLRGGADGEKAMSDMYSFFEEGSKGTMIMEGRLCSSQIDYIVEECTIDPNQAPPVLGMLSLLCPDPYFKTGSEESETIAGSFSTFRFPFHFPKGPFKISERIKSVFATVNNNGVAETDMKIEFSAKSRVENPALIDVKTGQTAKLRFTMEAGDVITITTAKGEKKITLLRGGKELNIFNYMLHPFTFFTLNSGENTFKYDADSGLSGLNVKIYYTAKFGAIYTNMKGDVPVTYEELERLVNETARIVKRGGLNG